MAKSESFDVSTGVDMQEVDNAVNQARKEIDQRYDFKGTKCTFEFDRAAGTVLLDADDAYKLEALKGVLKEKLARRKVPLKNIDEGKPEEGSLGRARQRISLKQGIDRTPRRRSRRTSGIRASRRSRCRSRAISYACPPLRVTCCRRSSPSCAAGTTASSSSSGTTASR
jgi:uncharacterized protein YajQ (UPF0234 family)